MTTDPIADFIAAIKNGQNANKRSILVPYSKIKESLARVLEHEGYLSHSKKVIKDKKNFLKVRLKYNDGKPAISEIKRISRPGLRVYSKSTGLPRVLRVSRHITDDLGVVIVSTPKGLITNKEAKMKKLGGELICKVY